MAVAVQVAVVDVELVVLRVARVEGEREEPALAVVEHAAAQVEERPRDLAVAHHLDRPALLDDVQRRRVAGRRGDVDRLVQAGRDLLERRRRGGACRRPRARRPRPRGTRRRLTRGKRTVAMVLPEGPLPTMSTGPLLALRLEPGCAARPPDRAADPRPDPLARASGRCRAAVHPRARRGSRRVARRRRRRVRAARRRGLHRAPPRRRADGRAARDGSRSRARGVGRARSPARASTSVPTFRISRSFPGRTGSRRAAPRSTAPRTPTSRTASPSARSSCDGSLAPFLARTRGVVAGPERTGVFAGTTQALFTIASRAARAGRAEDRASRIRGTAGARGRSPRPGSRSSRCRWTARACASTCSRGVSAVVVSPDHQFPLGVVALAGAPARARRVGRDGDRLVARARLRRPLPLRPAAGGDAARARAGARRIRRRRERAARSDAADRLGGAAGAARRPRRQPHVRNRGRGTATVAARARGSDRERRARPPPASRSHRVQAAPRGPARRARPALPGCGRRRRRRRPLRLSTAAGHGRGELLAAARGRGFALDGINEHALRPQPHGLVLGFAAAPEPTLRRAVTSLPS